MEHYHWHRYDRQLLQSHHFMQVFRPTGEFPFQRICRRTDFGFDDFNFLEAKVWILMSGGTLCGWTIQNGFRVMTLLLQMEHCRMASTDPSRLARKTNTGASGFCGNGEYLYPFDPFEKNIGRCTWVNSRHFAMVASTENRCRLLAELMHAYNVLANRKSVFSPEQGIMTLNGHTRIGEAPGENDEEGVRV